MTHDSGDSGRRIACQKFQVTSADKYAKTTSTLTAGLFPLRCRHHYPSQQQPSTSMTFTLRLPSPNLARAAPLPVSHKHNMSGGTAVITDIVAPRPPFITSIVPLQASREASLVRFVAQSRSSLPLADAENADTGAGVERQRQYSSICPVPRSAYSPLSCSMPLGALLAIEQPHGGSSNHSNASDKF